MARAEVIIAMIVLLSQILSSDSCLEEERAALMQLQHSFNYPRGTSLSPWDLNIDCCKWSRVVCNHTTGRINELRLYYLRDASLGDWNFNASLFLPFQQLRFLDIRFNKIVCCTHNEGFEALKRLSNLEILFLDGNGLTNNVIPMFQGFPSLKTLAMSYNKLNGSIYVKDLANVPNLEELCLSGNNIEKFVFSKGEYNFQNLKILDLNYSIVSNTFLQSIANINSLEILRLKGCKLTNIEELCKLKNLQWLDLQETGISGNLPPCLANLTRIEHLDLSVNELTGKLSSELCKLKNLQWINLQENHIGGNLPSCLVNLTLLQYLDISSNNFIGNISESPLKSLTFIEYLDMSYNLFQIPISLSPFLNHSKLKYLYADDGNEMYAESGEVDSNMIPRFQLEELNLLSTNGKGGVSFPRFLQHQHELKYLDLSGIQMRGARFPSWLLENNTNLKSLSLENCSLSGTLHLPTHLHAKLNNLIISDNQFYGHIPTEIGIYFPSLKTLSLHKNDFIGKIPNSLSNCSLLEVLVTSDNRLFGKIPEWIGNMPSLLVLDLSNNNFSGSLPFIPPQAVYIYLSHNRLEGPFPDALPNSDVLTLDLSHNFLTGGIPNSIENLYGLTYVLLNHNNFEGEIPTYLWKMMNKLKFVDLSHNRLGTLSFKNHISNISYSDGFTLDDDGILEFVLKGNTYQFGRRRMYDIGFVGLDLSSNNLACSIPFEIENKEGMKTLNLSHNNLTGHIPLSFSNMTEVESLDLSYNKLSGTFPPQLVQLTFLQVFSVAYNNLSGKTPQRVAQFATFEESSYRGNPFLCGEPLPRDCTLSTSSMTKESGIDDEDAGGFIDIEVFQISFWVTFTIILFTMALILYINPYWRQVWFYFIDVTIKSCYNFLVGHLPFLSKFEII